MNLKSTILCLAFALATAFTANAQEFKFNDLDKSPMDAVTYPRQAAWRNYLDGDDRKMAPKVRVLYSRPLKKGRTIFGDLVPYGKDWRLGANEATEVTFYQDVEIGGRFVARGTYTMFAEPQADNWTIKVSKERHIGGAQNRDESQDVVAVNVPVQRLGESRESFTIGYQKINEDLVHMVFEWDQVRAALPISFNPVYLASDDKSPMDLAQYPRNSRVRNYLEGAEKEAAMPKVRVTYGRPQMKGRTVFGELVKYGEPWRLGANETTEITFFQKVKVGDKEIRAGRYGIMCVPNKDNWEFVIHSDIPSWGVFGYDKEKEVARITVPTEKAPKTMEALSIAFDKKDDKNVHMVTGWEDTMVRLPIEIME